MSANIVIDIKSYMLKFCKDKTYDTFKTLPDNIQTLFGETSKYCIKNKKGNIKLAETILNFIYISNIQFIYKIKCENNIYKIEKDQTNDIDFLAILGDSEDLDKNIPIEIKSYPDVLQYLILNPNIKVFLNNKQIYTSFYIENLFYGLSYYDDKKVKLFIEQLSVYESKKFFIERKKKVEDFFQYMINLDKKKKWNNLLL